MPTPGNPLAGLRPLHSPPPVSWWPPAPGWWLLAGLVLLAVGLALLWYRRVRVQRATLAELAALSRTIGASNVCLPCMAALLKRYALYCYPDDGVATMTGEAWLRFLDDHGGQGGFTRGPGQVLGGALFGPGPDADLEAIERLARRWIRKNRPSGHKMATIRKHRGRR